MNDGPNQLAITLEYYAVFRACARKSTEELGTFAPTPVELYEQLRKQYRFPLESGLVKVAINDEQVPWDTALKAGDRLVFIPPVSGG